MTVGVEIFGMLELIALNAKLLKISYTTVDMAEHYRKSSFNFHLSRAESVEG